MIITLSNISVHQLKRAVIIREQIEQLEAELSGIFGEAPAPAEPATNGHTGRRKMSASARAKIAAAQRKRWAKQRKAEGKSPKASATAPKKRKHKMSAAGRAAISAAATARWAKAKAQNRRTLAG
ncbi:MAG: hypothetical protein JWR26_2068 [Pedosphaera sp.]|nr:hypothetical protein [Pedosphaera sp.]